MALELFHRLAEPDSASARRRVRELGLDAEVAFRNVEFDSHREALASRGGAATPALWDGTRLHVGLDAVNGALGAAAPAAPLPPAPDEAIAATGVPHLGAFAGAPGRAALERVRQPGLRGRIAHVARVKRWLYGIVVSDDVIAAAAAVEAGWFAGAFAWAVDRRTGEVLFDRSATGLPGVSARVGDRAGDGAHGTFRGGGLHVRFERRGGAWRFEVRAGDALRIDALLDAESAPAPFTLVAPVPAGGVRATVKAAPLPARGLVRARGRTLSLDGGLGGVDHTAGILARETAWRWAFGVGRGPAGAALAFNLCEGFPGVPASDAGENALFAGGGPTRLPPVAFAFDRDRPLAPWRVTSADGAVELAFRPQAVHREVRDLAVVKTRFAQVAGTFEGKVPGPGGAALDVTGVPGVVEDHWALW